MLVGWKYIYKRRGWTSKLIHDSLQEKTWNCFQDYFSERNIECPPKSEFDIAHEQFLKSQISEKKVEEVTKVTTPAKKQRRSRTRKKATKNESAS